MKEKSLFDKVWERHLIGNESSDLIYIDLHLVHEVTSPQAFEGLRLANRKVRRPDKTIATADHNVPTNGAKNLLEIEDSLSRKQIETLEKNCKDFGIPVHSLGSSSRGIVHVIGPELGLTQPGMTIVCGDSHTATHGAFGALAFGIGTSEVEHVLATQTLVQNKSKSMRVNYKNRLPIGCEAKDIILYTLSQLGTGGFNGHVVEYAGEEIEKMTMEGRMTICNMTIEGGGRAGMIAPDETTWQWIQNKKYAPLEKPEFWDDLKTDKNATFDKEIEIDLENISPQVSWGTTPAMVIPIQEKIPFPKNETEERALKYMDLKPRQSLQGLKIDRVFIGSCTNSRLLDLENAAKIVEGKKVAEHVRAMVVPGSEKVKKEAEEKGIDQIFINAGFEWRSSGCSMCLGMNPDILKEKERCASTSNRNFEGRQGKGGRTHLLSPPMAAWAAIQGSLEDVREA